MNLDLPITGERVQLEAAGKHRIGIRRIRDGEIVGAAEVEPQPLTLTIRALYIEGPHRGYGCGSEAARLLIDAAAASGYERLCASAPPELGLAVYFWFRMGLHPLHGEGPGGGIWLERRLR